MFDEKLLDENVGWPSYVDFLSTFVFILLLFVGAIVYLLTGVADEQRMQKRLTGISVMLENNGLSNVIEGHSIRISLQNKVTFALNESSLDEESRRNLRGVVGQIANAQPVRRIIVQGFADKLKVKSDPEFGNWQLSVDRALAVLRFLYTCEDCGLAPELRARLVLRGDGDLDAANSLFGSPGDRRVDIVLDLEDYDR